MSLEPFATSKPLTMGVELELQIVNRHDYDLIELFAPHLTRRVVDMTLQGGGEAYQL